jgi:histidine phosphotransfer protein HptB
MNTTFIHSSLAADSDPELVELIERFVQKMPDRINDLEEQARNHNWEQLARTAHQLKGTAGSYGFGILTPYTDRFELAAKHGRDEKIILLALDDLLDLCRRMHSGVPQFAASNVGLTPIREDMGL